MEIIDSNDLNIWILGITRCTPAANAQLQGHTQKHGTNTSHRISHKLSSCSFYLDNLQLFLPQLLMWILLFSFQQLPTESWNGCQ